MSNGARLVTISGTITGEVTYADSVGLAVSCFSLLFLILGKNRLGLSWNSLFKLTVALAATLVYVRFWVATGIPRSLYRYFFPSRDSMERIRDAYERALLMAEEAEKLGVEHLKKNECFEVVVSYIVLALASLGKFCCS